MKTKYKYADSLKIELADLSRAERAHLDRAADTIGDDPSARKDRRPCCR